MPRPSAKVVAVVSLLGLLGWNVHARLRPEAELSAADRAVLAVTGPAQSAITASMRAARGLVSGYVLAVGARRDVEALRTELAVARAAVAELDELRAENDRLRAVAGLRERAAGRTVGATVVGRGTSPRFRTVRIDRGTDDGVRPGMAVLAVEGAVGRVLRAGGGHADVLLLTDGLSAVGAVVQRSRLRTIAAGSGGDALDLGFVGRSDLPHVAAGDRLVTSGDDGVFPEGVPLGVVTSAKAPETGLFLDLEVEPVVALDRVEEVLVVVEPGVGPYPLLPAGDALALPDDVESLEPLEPAEGTIAAPGGLDLVDRAPAAADAGGAPPPAEGGGTR